MLKSEIKRSIILLIFASITIDFLTGMTILFLLIGVGFNLLKVKPTRLIRNTLALVVLFSYWFKFGKIIDPEVGLNFLTTVIVLKILEKESRRDSYMIMMGLILLVSVGSLFEKTLFYLIFFILSFFTLLHDFYQQLGVKVNFKDFTRTVIWIIPFAAFLFLTVPRLMSPIPFFSSSTRTGEMGHTPDVLISGIESLRPSDRPAFSAFIKGHISQHLLYWRGNVLERNDGWNWYATRGEEITGTKNYVNNPSNSVSQDIKLHLKSEYFFALDVPISITAKGKNYTLNQSGTLPQRRYEQIERYSVIGQTGPLPLEVKLQNSTYLNVILSMKDKAWINKTFKSDSFESLLSEIKDYYLKEGFIYSLSPGKIESFSDFMKKKVGFCSHFASATALILRVKKIPARLVSGHMGGAYNRFADFYLITQNDAHVWVEAIKEEKWQRLDPTEWIAPERVDLGGDAFVNSLNPGIFKRFKFNKWFSIHDFESWLRQWDFKFYTWLEEFNYFAQDVWLKKLQLKRKWLYFIIPGLLSFFVFIYAYQLHRRKKELSKEMECWDIFLSKLERRNIHLPLGSIHEASNYLMKMKHPEQEKIIRIWNNLIRQTYRDNLEKSLKKELESL